MLVPPTYSGTDTFYLSVYSNAISWGGYQLQYNTLIDTIYISNPVGIIENHISSLSISPNPTSNELNISLSKNSVSEIMVVDLQGKEKIKLTTKESFTKLDVNSLMNGVYLLVVKNPDVVYQEKFVVIK
ncbi:MAG: T9SS type A sorting domain-containing protein [Bacteroidetes bacterium]|nr:T9SS type A sorting domain-containing protein [Bacteroidota bacterium]